MTRYEDTMANSADGELNRLELQLLGARTERTSLKNQITRLQQRCDELRNKRKNSKEALSQCRQERDSLITSYENMSFLHADAVREVIVLREEVSRLRARFMDAKEPPIRPSADEVELVAEALMLACPSNNPDNPPSWPNDFSIDEQSAYRNPARGAIEAMFRTTLSHTT